MAIRCWWLMGWVITAAGVALATPAVSGSNGLTNPAMDKVQSEAPADQLAESELRNPFWPVGYSPVTKTVPAVMPAAEGATASSVAPVAEDLMKKALTMLRFGGIIRRGTNCYATVNGTMVEAGDTIPIIVDGTVVIFNVRSVDMKRIRLEPASK